jgi:hypothetical protein
MEGRIRLGRKLMRGPGRQEGISTDVTPGPIGVENGAAGFSGKLRNFPLLDIIQMACVARRDGRLLVRRRGETGEIVLRDGRIMHAVTKSKTGEPRAAGCVVLEPRLLRICADSTRTGIAADYQWWLGAGSNGRGTPTRRTRAQRRCTRKR